MNRISTYQVYKEMRKLVLETKLLVDEFCAMHENYKK
jgi:hypothetical protein